MPSGYTVNDVDLDNIFYPKLLRSTKAADVGFTILGEDISNRYEPLKLGNAGKISYDTNFKKSSTDLRDIFQGKGTFSASIEYSLFQHAGDSWLGQGRIISGPIGYKYKLSTPYGWDLGFITVRSIAPKNSLRDLLPTSNGFLDYTNSTSEAGTRLFYRKSTATNNITISTIEVYTNEGIATGLIWNIGINFNSGANVDGASGEKVFTMTSARTTAQKETYPNSFGLGTDKAYTFNPTTQSGIPDFNFVRSTITLDI